MKVFILQCSFEKNIVSFFVALLQHFVEDLSSSSKVVTERSYSVGRD